MLDERPMLIPWSSSAWKKRRQAEIPKHGRLIWYPSLTGNLGVFFSHSSFLLGLLELFL
jgi:hypothetical protein